MLAIPLGALAALALAVPTAFFAFRLQGAYFAIGTWVIAEVTRLLIAQWKTLGGGTGTSLPREATSNIMGTDLIQALFGVREAAARDILAYLLALVLAIAVTVASTAAAQPPRPGAVGRARQHRGGPVGGCRRRPAQMAVFLIASAATGLTGALIFLQTARISPDAAFAVTD